MAATTSQGKSFTVFIVGITVGWVIVGGMTVGTLLTLFVVPTAYTLLAGRERVRETEGTATSHATPSAGSAD